VELSPTTGKLHCQVYLRFASQVAEVSVRALFPTGDHVEKAKGDEASNVKYCSKEESHVLGPFEIGERAKPGKRSDLALARVCVADGKGMRQMVDELTSYQGLRCAELILKYKERVRDFQPEVRWYHGSTGGGKTRDAFEEFPGAWFSGKDGKWFDGYDAHEVCVLDDFRKDFCSFSVLLRMLDRYPFRIENKGGSRQLLAKVVIITCPWAPDVLYDNRSQEDIGQLMRRITLVRLYGNIVPPPGHYQPVGNQVSVPHFRAAP